jgi:hypothetical protein
VLGATEQFADVNFVPVALGRFFTAPEVEHRRQRRGARLQPVRHTVPEVRHRPGRQESACRRLEYTVVGVLAQRPSAIGQQDDFVVIPQTTHQIVFGSQSTRGPSAGRSRSSSCREDRATRSALLGRGIMRIRHGLKLDEPNDFDIGDPGCDSESVGTSISTASSRAIG